MWNYVSSSILFLLRAVSNCFPSALTHQILRILPYLFLGCVCYGFDAIFSKIEGEYAPYIGAVADNAAHGIIAFFSWCIVCEIHIRKHLIDGVLCGIIACAIDLDHFIAAKSFKLKDALQLKNRPFLHTTTVVFIVVPMLQVWLAQNNCFLRSLPYLFTVGVSSHHLRDGNRHGLWFWPLGSTPPLPYWIYICCIVALPFIVKETKANMDKLVVIPVAENNVVLLDV